MHLEIDLHEARDVVQAIDIRLISLRQLIGYQDEGFRRRELEGDAERLEAVRTRLIAFGLYGPTSEPRSDIPHTS